jgi:dTDP-4-amino-4,6-dideoxygalactose transaminase
MIVEHLPEHLKRHDLTPYTDLTPQQVVNLFEQKIANFFGSKYCVLTDCCTHALELCLRLHTPKQPIELTQWTYMSIGMMLDKLNIEYYLSDIKWVNYYSITNKIIDAAPYWQKNGYLKDTLFCISFQYKKHCPIGKGGAILLDDEHDYNLLQCMVYDGRNRNLLQTDDNVSILGYHYHMIPEDAARGISIFEYVKDIPAIGKHWNDYVNLKEYDYFRNR